MLKSSFVSLGIPCDITVNEPSIDSINIILGGHLIQNISALKSFRYIPYQLEQLNAIQGFYTQNFHDYLSCAVTVWDYSHQNISFLDSKGIKARYVPIGYHRNLEQISQDHEKEYDVLFYGSTGPRRNTILQKLIEEGVKVKTLFGVYGPERDREIAKSKIIINIHQYDTKIFETVRISYLLNNSCFAVSENSPLNPYSGLDIPLVPYEELVQTCSMYLQNVIAREKIRLRCYRQFREKYDMTEILRKALQNNTPTD